MALVEGKDFVFAPKATFVTTDVSAVNTCSVIGTRERLFVVMENVLEGAGGRMTETTFSFAGRKPAEALNALLNAPETTLASLGETLTRIIGGDPKFCVEIAGLTELKVKNGWFSRGIYCKQKGAWGYSPAVAVSDKEVVGKFQTFFGQ